MRAIADGGFIKPDVFRPVTAAYSGCRRSENVRITNRLRAESEPDTAGEREESVVIPRFQAILMTAHLTASLSLWI